jgi:hypothetical protein
MGIATMLAMSGNLERPHDGAAPSIYGTNILVVAVGQIVLFVAALTFTVASGFSAL